MLYETPKGFGLVRAVGADAACWLIAPLLAGNSVLLVASPSLASVAEALHAAGVPRNVLRVDSGDTRRLIGLAASASLAFVACDAGPFRALTAALGPIAVGQTGLKTLISPLDGPHPREAGFIRRFAWPKVIATRTLRHGADLSLPPVEPTVAN